MQATKDITKTLKTLRSRSDFLSVRAACDGAQGQKWVSHGLIVQAAKADHDHIGVGYTVTKRTEKSAVKRNRIKRRLRAVAADILPTHAKTGCDYVLIGRPLTRLRPYDDLKNDLIWCLKKMGYARDKA